MYIDDSVLVILEIVTTFEYLSVSLYLCLLHSLDVSNQLNILSVFLPAVLFSVRFFHSMHCGNVESHFV